MRKYSVVSILTLVIVGTFILACSDNNDNAKTEGNPNDYTYLQAKSATEAYVDSVVNDINFASNYMSFDGTSPLNVTADSANVNYDPQTCWWEIYLSADTTGSSLLFIDSVTFSENGNCQMFPDSTTTTDFEYRALAQFNLTADSGSVGFEAHENVTISGIQSDQIVVGGTNSSQINLSVIADTSQLSFDYNYSGSATSVAFNRADLESDTTAHPISGGLNLGLNMALSGPNGTASTTWTITVTFFVDHYHAYAESGDNFWEWDYYYEPPL